MKILGKLTAAAILIAAILGAITLVLEFDRRLGLYWYDVRADYRYSIAEDSVARVPVRIGRNSVEIPLLDGSWDTAILPIRVKTSWTSVWFEPEIEFSSASSVWTHTLERRAEGLRFLVLDPTSLKTRGPLRLTGKHIGWNEQDSELLLFATPEIENARLLVLAPHADDAEIAAFGLYSSHFTYIITITAGNYVDGRYSHLLLDTESQDDLRGRVRVWDSLTVPLWGGVPAERVVNLGYGAGLLKRFFDEKTHGTSATSASTIDPNRYRSGAISELLPGREASANWDSVVSDLATLLTATRPSVIVTPHPALDISPEHQYATIALLEALRQVEDNETTLLLYTNHHVLGEYYPFGPTDSAVTLPPWIDSPLDFSSVYSYSLTDELRLRKLFALEAMHDLRPPPDRLLGGPTERFLIRVSSSIRNLIRNPLGTYDYIRRAVRKNEVFFVVRPEDREYLMPPET